MDAPAQVVAVARRQLGVVHVAQLSALGVSRSLVQRRVVAQRWQRLHDGVLALHSGPVTWRARAQAALLLAGDGAALSHGSAAHLLALHPTAPTTITVSLPHRRRVVAPPGIRLVRRRRMPPALGELRVVNHADTVVDLVSEASGTDEVIALLTAAARGGTPPGEILRVAARRSRLRHRALLTTLLVEVEDGVESPLELRYRRDVERRHGLPRAELQVRERLGDRRIRADSRYRGLRVRVELDGRLAHPGGRTDSDTWRDNQVVLAHGEVTLRYRWRHVAAAPCATASQVVRALRAGGWTGAPRACGAACPVR